MRIRIEKNDDGFLAYCKSIDGAFAEGDTEFDAFYNLMDVIRMIADYKSKESKESKRKLLDFNIPIAI